MTVYDIYFDDELTYENVPYTLMHNILVDWHRDELRPEGYKNWLGMIKIVSKFKEVD